ncbi:MAG TPA: MazG family protein, partial [Bacillota bacterium]
MNDREAAAGRGAAFARLVEVVERLRGPDGCPWDRQQTHDSLKPYLLEETYEVLAALDDAVGKPHKLREELGDLLLQILLHSVIAGERGAFTVTDVVEGLRDKLIRRHPHVFGDVEVSSVDEVNRRWQAIKAQEREESDDGQGSSLLEGVAEGLPPMARAYA